MTIRSQRPSLDRATESPWVLVAGGFHSEGGMDCANAELARFLCSAGVPVHLVAFRIAEEFVRYPNATTHLVRMMSGSTFMSEWNLQAQGRRVAANVRARFPFAHLLANGGNCVLSDVNWVHCVQNAWDPHDSDAPNWFRVKNRLAKLIDRRREKRALSTARLIVANSERTSRDLVGKVNVSPECIRTIYLGCDERWKSITAERRELARAWLGEPQRRPLIAFVGALGYDNNKGLDTLWSAWRSLCGRADWDVDLIVAGGGRALPRWRDTITQAGLESRVRMLGFTDRITDVLAAVDLLISPVRYESYGLNVQEAISCLVPAMVSRIAGVAERYPAELGDLLLPQPDDAEDLAVRLLRWRSEMENLKRRIVPFAIALRARTWRDMAAEIVAAVESRRTN
jgi:glycosyltransferase involved in cell wall biosynthesis